MTAQGDDRVGAQAPQQQRHRDRGIGHRHQHPQLERAHRRSVLGHVEAIGHWRKRLEHRQVHEHVHLHRQRRANAVDADQGKVAGQALQHQPVDRHQRHGQYLGGHQRHAVAHRLLDRCGVHGIAREPQVAVRPGDVEHTSDGHRQQLAAIGRGRALLQGEHGHQHQQKLQPAPTDPGEHHHARALGHAQHGFHQAAVDQHRRHHQRHPEHR
ncbi:hypothetical protein D3C80_1379920 [compost metagenome]